jgi:hypothetical protein
MDTNELSQEAYEGIIIEAEKFNHDLTLQYGLLSYACDDEQQYLEEAMILSKEILKVKPHELDDIFFGQRIDKAQLKEALNKILANIEVVKAIPIEQRNFDF